MKFEFNVVSFSELSKEAKKTAKENISAFLFDVVSLHVTEIKDSRTAYLNAYNNGLLGTLDKNDLPLTGVYYDYDFMEIDLNSNSVEQEANKVFLKLKRDEKRNVFSDEYVSDLCDGNDILFLENGTEFKTVEKLLNGLI